MNRANTLNTPLDAATTRWEGEAPRLLGNRAVSASVQVARRRSPKGVLKFKNHYITRLLAAGATPFAFRALRIITTCQSVGIWAG